MFRILILSNGHGEDLSGTLLAQKLILLGNKVDALPMVGFGNEYKKAKINIVGKTRKFNTGGLGYNSLKGRISDLINGQIIYFFRKILLTLSIRGKYDYFIVVGDIVPIFAAWLSRKIFFTYLVAYSSHYEGKLNMPWPCKYFLKSSNSRNIYSRDFLTALDLTSQLRKEVIFLGNPFMDKLKISKGKSKNFFEIALLPGSRVNELINNFCLMLDLLELISSTKFYKKVKFSFALINDFKSESVEEILKSRNWQYINKAINPNNLIYSYKNINVKFKWKSFEEILNNCDLAISMSGTAAEQVIGIAKPVVQIEGFGPQFTKTFAEAQRRLLGDFVFCYTNYTSKYEQLDGTINLILKIMYLIKLDNSFLINCKKIANNRIGSQGATLNIVSNIEKNLKNVR